MSENTPLIRAAYEEEFEDEDVFRLSHRAKVILSAVGAVFILAAGYFFCFFLPSVFIPPSVELHGIVKLDRLNVSLALLDEERVAQLGMLPRGDVDEEDGDEEQRVSDRSVERLIMVGDVHGHFDEFSKLLRKVNYDSKTDHLLVLGDFITKGPDSIKVLDYLIENQVDCVLGNHEYYVLQNYASFHGLRSPYFVNGSSYISSGFNTDPEFLLAKKLQPHHVKYINRCAIIKKLGPMPLHKVSTMASYKSAPGVAVHAGLRWDLALNQQEPIENLEVRSYLKPFYNETTSDAFTPHSVSWSKIFNRKQKVSETPVIVYYGHAASRGLDLKKFTKGIDSGCDKGEHLSAMVVWNELGTKGRALHREQIFQVDCSGN